MINSSYFTDSQKQFNESQKKIAELWEESLKQLSETQKKLVYTWVDSLRSGNSVQGNYSENFEKALKFQQDLIDAAINAQQITLGLTIETQKQFWDNYFQVAQKAAQETVNK
jgi:phage regulator Rha-like protein